ncbi:hypothetical protein [Longitalea luteola]|uniref:hypothetical protein n=1 Tax=Longitalea luteola TaxID=2812563 RepID=UPI001A972AFD|nr:hypothetical protein [Longitalea luteola]
MITIENYFDQIQNIDRTNFPSALSAGHNFIVKATDNGNDLAAYNMSDKVKNTIDLYLDKLNAFISGSSKKETKQPRKAKKGAGHTVAIDEYMPAQEPIPTENKKTKHSKKNKVIASQTAPVLVEKIPEELRFIKRFVYLNGKSKTKDEILRFINSLQKAIVEKRIRKTSNWADQIRLIQNKLIDWYNSMKQKISIDIEKEGFYNDLKALVYSEAIMPSINFIKRYISLNGKPDVKDKARKLLEHINKAFDKGKLTNSDLYISAINDIKGNLEEFLANKREKTLQIEKAELNGLQGILGCACTPLNGLDGKPAIMNSMDFAEMQFDTLGFTGKWLRLIGDPSSNFSVMVFGKPKMGKSYLCVDFAGYLARNHGKVLYVAKEEGLDMTLQKKLNEKHVAHPNLFVASVLPSNLAKYNFVFLVSVNRMGLIPEDLNKLKAANPGKSFIFIFQTTKDGKFRGANTFQHDVDVVIEVPEKGKAVQMGRFNQGGEIDIFERDDWRMAA